MTQDLIDQLRGDAALFDDGVYWGGKGLPDRITQAADTIDALRAALKPFQVSIRPEIPDDEVIDTIAHTAGDYRRAALHIRDGE